MSKFMQNLNNNILGAVGIKTTGLDPKKHDIMQIAVIPLDSSVAPDKRHIPFQVDMKPNRPENIDPDAVKIDRQQLCDIQVRGVDQDRAADYLVEWWERLGLAWNKRIMLIGFDWFYIKSFLVEWLGPTTFDLCFDPICRDVQIVSTFCNDRDGWIGRDFTYPKVDFNYLCTQLRIERVGKKDALETARLTAEIYKRIVQQFV